MPMRKKRNLYLFLFIFSLLLLVQQTESKAEDKIIIKDDEIAKGKVSILYNKDSDKKIKFSIQKGKARQTFNLSKSANYVNFPLSMGNGEYKLTIYENTEGNKYRPLMSKSVQVEIEKEDEIFLHSIQEIDWKDKKVIGFLKDRLDQEEKRVGRKLEQHEIVGFVYQHILDTLAYDYDKINRLAYNYLPDVDEVYKEKQGICYDYSSLFAAVLRSQNIPTKLVKGYADGVKDYHAWNEVLINHHWTIVDTTSDSVYYKAGAPFEFEKSSEHYKKTSEL